MRQAAEDDHGKSTHRRAARATPNAQGTSCCGSKPTSSSFPASDGPRSRKSSGPSPTPTRDCSLKNLAADDDGLFASVLIESPEDNAAVEVSYEMGDAIAEQNMQWAKELQDRALAEAVAVDRLGRCAARRGPLRAGAERGRRVRSRSR